MVPRNEIGAVPPSESRRAAVAAFCLYDFGNSAFATTILAVLFNQYFAQQVAGGAAGVRLFGTAIPGATLYTWLVSLTMLLIAVSGPVLGAWADAGGHRMTMLRLLTLVGVAGTIGLASVGPGEWVRGSILFVIAYGTFAAASIFYNAILPGLGRPDQLGRISGLAWGLGYAGGGIVLLLSLLLIRRPDLVGLDSSESAVRASFAMAGIWWALFALPQLLRREDRLGRPAEKATLAEGVRRALATLRGLRRSKHFRRYLLAFFFYKDGIETVVATASIFAAVELGFTPEKLILLFLLIQATGLLGALAGGRIADRFGHKRTILTQLIGWIGITVWARWVGWLGDPIGEFWVIGGTAGLLLGGVQTTSRSLLARWIPPERSAEIFGFFAVAGRFAAVGGPLLFGAMSWITGGLRPAILSVSLLFVVGAILLVAVDEEAGGQELRA